MLTEKVRRKTIIDKKSTIMTAADNAAPSIEFRRFQGPRNLRGCDRFGARL